MLVLDSRSRGDTLIEVLFAIAIFSLVVVGSLAIMNQGTAASQRALEITMVRNEIDAQAETLRFLNASYISAYASGGYTDDSPAGQWRTMKQYMVDSPLSTSSSGVGCQVPANGKFILDAKNAKFIPQTTANVAFNSAQTFSQVTYDVTSPTSQKIKTADGIWIEAMAPVITNNNGQKSADYIDFYIRACWSSPGQSAPVTIGTIVRLYEPRG
ncbi:MAG: prepilin-type N-terminal cleavage/methylation domain-containing protein [Candidatus Saccharibacteria bacterium]